MLEIFQLLSLPLFGTPFWVWLAFLAIVLFLLVFDLGVLHKKDKAMSFRESLYLSLFYVAVSLVFGGWVWLEYSADRALPYFTAYVVEKSLSLDNVFVMSVIFSYYAIPLKYQHRVLFWGILGVLILRGICIALGTVLVAKFAWLLFFFGALLIYTGITIIFDDDGEPDIDKSRFRKFLTKYFNVSDKIEGHHFFVKKADKKGRMVTFMTPLFVALITIEFADLLFAMDSIPAVLAISTDTFIVFSSNIFAILGLRAMYFMLATLLERFKYLKFALAVVLVFIGGKIFYNAAGGHITPSVSLVATLVVLIGGAVFSFMATRHQEAKDEKARKRTKGEG